ncbi:hypothetical protein GH714_038705 [Hevea brasiliensis]|uniref:Uncharacterized protein n=1 Tax=Hevea brasiliensis TaxID=3981 RepID=A0A6A6L810_HEVBR|nr:hypothetical protein GH714_038705 [Hevea brasiliensis]
MSSISSNLVSIYALWGSKSYVVEESNNEMEDKEGRQGEPENEEVEDEIIEVDFELNGKIVELDNDSP